MDRNITGAMRRGIFFRLTGDMIFFQKNIRKKSFTKPKLETIYEYDYLEPEPEPEPVLVDWSLKSICSNCKSENSHILKQFICKNCKTMNFNSSLFKFF